MEVIWKFKNIQAVFPDIFPGAVNRTLGKVFSWTLNQFMEYILVIPGDILE